MSRSHRHTDTHTPHTLGLTYSHTFTCNTYGHTHTYRHTHGPLPTCQPSLCHSSQHTLTKQLFCPAAAFSKLLPVFWPFVSLFTDSLPREPVCSWLSVLFCSSGLSASQLYFNFFPSCCLRWPPEHMTASLPREALLSWDLKIQQVLGVWALSWSHCLASPGPKAWGPLSFFLPICCPLASTCTWPPFSLFASWLQGWTLLSLSLPSDPPPPQGSVGLGSQGKPGWGPASATCWLCGHVSWSFWTSFLLIEWGGDRSLGPVKGGVTQGGVVVMIAVMITANNPQNDGTCPASQGGVNTFFFSPPFTGFEVLWRFPASQLGPNILPLESGVGGLGHSN